MLHASDVTAIDNYCGAGGSTTGLKAAGVRVIHAANHWDRAIATHNTNHPEIDHSCVDLNVAHPGCFPRTTIAWFSIECSTHSPAGGRKRRQPGQLDLFEAKAPDPSVERSRMGAWDVVRFAEYHRYQCVLVENVVEFTEWELYEEWLKVMLKLGYNHQVVCFNSQFAYPEPVPQSRDRIYVVFSRKGNRQPVVDFTPPAVCPEHGQVLAVQAWKPHVMRRVGKYGKRNQYLYVCPHCGQEVSPVTRPARSAIDWSLPMVKIGERAAHGLKPLSENTLRRIRTGLERFTVPYLIHRGHWQDPGRVYTTEMPMPTQTTKQEMGLISPPDSAPFFAPAFIDAARTHNTPTSVDAPTPTLTTGRNLSVVVPPFLGGYHGGRDAVHPIDQPSPTIATNKQLHVVQPFLSSYYGNGGESPVDAPAPTLRTRQGHALIDPDWSALVEECGYRMIRPHEAKWLMGFPRDYAILGNQEEQFKQAGNAVTPMVATMLGRAVIDSLS